MVPPGVFNNILKPELGNISSEIEPPLILHICGDIDPIIPSIMELGFDGVSIGAGVSVKEAKIKANDETKLLGNISPDTLANGSSSQVKEEVSNAIDQGFDFIEPDDGFVPVASLDNIKTMVETTKEIDR